MFIGLGEYHLRVAYQDVNINIEDLQLISTKSPGDIVPGFKDKLVDVTVNTESITAVNLSVASENFAVASQPSIFSRAIKLLD